MNKFLSLVLLEGALIASLGISNVAAVEGATVPGERPEIVTDGITGLTVEEAKKKYSDFRDDFLPKLIANPNWADFPMGAFFPASHKVNRVYREFTIGTQYLQSLRNDSPFAAQAYDLYVQAKETYLKLKKMTEAEGNERYEKLKALPFPFRVPFHEIGKLLSMD
jgi:hypothetical protein